MTKLVRLLAVLALMLCGITAVRASTETVIATMKGRQATQWRRTIVDLNLVGSYYDDPAKRADLGRRRQADRGGVGTARSHFPRR